MDLYGISMVEWLIQIKNRFLKNLSEMFYEKEVKQEKKQLNKDIVA